ncbi:hypothetical protein [Amycolatopsis sp. PS_44_ISF1]|uniref:hypothetical protein n=1 Tax=Amycolatopsis sp. PS_44_ISF1 TaxID=2974917 RepID=UPI0028DF2D15|nr:hypothetical protein [Amycolatopsis sp. PS_44_ISF1]MDT8915745.1 hypothetical protein [Amycolatopsis sp. PS_44_ISF1]
MGAILEKADENGPFGVEVRSESFYVVTDPDALVLSAMRNAEGGGRFGVPAAELKAFVSAVAQALGHPTASGAKLADRDSWVVTQNGGDVVVGGPVITFGTDELERKPVQSIELEYGDAYWLARALEPLARS